MTIELTMETERRLAKAAEAQGVLPEEVAARLVEEHLPQPNLAAMRLLDSLLEGDAEEQRETGEYLIRVLDEDRPGQRKLFPPEMKGITW